MKRLILFLSIISSFSFYSCEKPSTLGEKIEFDYEFPCALGECDPCGDLDFIDPSTIGKTVQQIIIEPIQFDEACGCIVRGLVKYVDCGKTIAIVYYGNGECDGKGLRTLCVGGDCEVAEAKTCEFDMECDFN